MRGRQETRLNPNNDSFSVCLLAFPGNYQRPGRLTDAAFLRVVSELHIFIFLKISVCVLESFSWLFLDGCRD